MARRLMEDISVKALFDQIKDPRLFAEAIVATIREPMLVIDGRSKILFANASFHRAFDLGPHESKDRELFALDNCAWDIPDLHVLLERLVPKHTIVDGFEIAHEFPRVGRRVLLLHARMMPFEDDARITILVGFDDITDRRAIEREREQLQLQTTELLRQKGVLLEEMQHRVVNSLQIIASILLLKARAVTSEETREHLKDAHRRVMSVAALQQHLHSSGSGDPIEIAPYLSKLCDSLRESMIGDSRPATLSIQAEAGNLVSADAISLGLIVTELVINSLKYAFPKQKDDAAVAVRYEVNGTDWKLSVSDNGIGRPNGTGKTAKGGLGTSLVIALAHQLDAQVETTSGASGMNVTVTHATFTSRAPQAA